VVPLRQRVEETCLQNCVIIPTSTYLHPYLQNNSPFEAPTLPSTTVLTLLLPLHLKTFHYTQPMLNDVSKPQRRGSSRNSTVTGNTMTKEDVLHTLFTNAKLLQIWAICPYGGMGPMLRRFLFGDDPIHPLSFTTNKPHAARMYLESLQSSAPHGILPLANSSWSSSKPAHQKFYGHSYTAPTPRIHFLQQFSLACTKAFAIHLRRPTRTQQAPQASSGTARAPPGLSSPFSTDPRV